jgi:preprotein translocase subunit SecG
MFVIFSVFYILVAAAMIVLILLQNGAGADAGSGFGGGASATVFGARGSSTFLTRATGVLAALFFLLSLGMGIYLHNSGAQQSNSDLGIMAGVDTTQAAKTAAPVRASGSEVPTAAPVANKAVPAATSSSKSPSALGVPAPGTPTKKH